MTTPVASPAEEVGVHATPLDAHKKYTWLCTSCEQIVEPECVTFYEYHDRRAGGCGGLCVPAEQRTPSPDPIAQAVREAVEVERAACAQLALEFVPDVGPDSEWSPHDTCYWLRGELAAAIRARGQRSET